MNSRLDSLDKLVVEESLGSTSRGLWILPESDRDVSGKYLKALTDDGMVTWDTIESGAQPSGSNGSVQFADGQKLGGVDEFAFDSGSGELTVPTVSTYRVSVTTNPTAPTDATTKQYVDNALLTATGGSGMAGGPGSVQVYAGTGQHGHVAGFAIADGTLSVPGKISGVAAPDDDSDAANKKYVDDGISGKTTYPANGTVGHVQFASSTAGQFNSNPAFILAGTVLTVPGRVAGVAAPNIGTDAANMTYVNNKAAEAAASAAAGVQTYPSGGDSGVVQVSNGSGTFGPAAGLTFSGTTLTVPGKIVNVGDPDDDGDAANKGYVDDTVKSPAGPEGLVQLSDGDGNFVARGGLLLDSLDNLSVPGKIINVGDPDDDGDAANKQYVDDKATVEAAAAAASVVTYPANGVADLVQVSNGSGTFKSVAGFTIADSVLTVPDRITGVATPTANLDAANKAYVDAEVAAASGTPSSGVVDLIQISNGDGSFKSDEDFSLADSVLTVPGKITGVAAPTANLDAANKAYVDTKTNTKSSSGTLGRVQLADGSSGFTSDSGMTMITGILTVPGRITGVAAPAAANDATNRTYVDDKAAEAAADAASGVVTYPADGVADLVQVSNGSGTFKSVTGFTIADSVLTVPGRITGVATPAENLDAANKAYVDTAVSGAGGGASSDGVADRVQLSNGDGTFKSDAGFTYADSVLTVSGRIAGVATPTETNDAATKAYVDTTMSSAAGTPSSGTAGLVQLADGNGGLVSNAGFSFAGTTLTVQGLISGVTDPAADQDVATKKYVDTALSSAAGTPASGTVGLVQFSDGNGGLVSNAGFSFAGSTLTVPGLVSNVTEPVDAKDAANKTYVDTKAASEAASAAAGVETYPSSGVADLVQVSNGSGTFRSEAGFSIADSVLTVPGRITGVGAPTEVNDAATKKYVDDEVAGKTTYPSDGVADLVQVSNGSGTFKSVAGFSIASGTLTVPGRVTGVGAPTTDTDAATKKYVDDEVKVSSGTDGLVQLSNGDGTFKSDAGLSFAGTTLTVPGKIAGVATPTAGTDAANKAYVDTAAASAASGVETYPANGVADLIQVSNGDGSFTSNAGFTFADSVLTVPGRIAGVAAPTAAGDAANKQYVDDEIAGKETYPSSGVADLIQVSNGSGTFKSVAGFTIADSVLTVPGRVTGVTDPTADSDAATKAYVDSSVSGASGAPSIGDAGRVQFSGGSGTFNSAAGFTFADSVLTVPGRITGVATPTADADAANKAYVDTAVSGASGAPSDGDAGRVQFSGGSGTFNSAAGFTFAGSLLTVPGRVTGVATPTAAGDATNKQYVDAEVKVSSGTDGLVQLSGGSGTFKSAAGLSFADSVLTVPGKIAGVATPTAGTDAANKSYVDTAAASAAAGVETYPSIGVVDLVQVAVGDGTFKSDTGFKLTGSVLTVPGRITGVGAPTADADAATKQYVDDETAAAAAGVETYPSNGVADFIQVSNGSGTFKSVTLFTIADGVLTVPGRITGVASPDAGTDATNRTYVDAKAASEAASAAAGVETYPANGVADLIQVSNGSGTFKSVAGFTFADSVLTVPGRITGVATPTADADAANKAYVDTAVSGAGGGASSDGVVDLIQLSNGDGTFKSAAGFTYADSVLSVSGRIAGVTAPTAGTDAATKAYVDTAVSGASGSSSSGANGRVQVSDGSGAFVDFDNFTMVGTTLTVPGLVSNVTEPVDDKDAANKTYVDTKSASEAAAAAAGVTTYPSDGVADLIQVSNGSGTFRTETGFTIADSLLTVPGKIAGVAAPVDDKDAANKKYVDDGITGKTTYPSVGPLQHIQLAHFSGQFAFKENLAMVGDNLRVTGRITSVSTPTDPNDAANKQYVDDEVKVSSGDSGEIQLSGGGGTFSSDAGLSFSGTTLTVPGLISGVTDPAADQDAATKKYVDDEVGAVVTYPSDGAAGAVQVSNGDSTFTSSTDLTFGGGKLESRALKAGRFHIVSTLADLPAAVSGAITLADNTTYLFAGDIDLAGARLVLGTNQYLTGIGGNNCSLTSTGLTGSALITSQYAMNFRGIKVCDVPILFDATAIDGDQSMGWYDSNFSNIPDLGTVSGYSNILVQTCGLVNCSGLVFTGTTGTIAFSDSLLLSDAAGAMVTFSGVVTRRVRFLLSSFILTSTAVGINFVPVSTPAQSFIIENCNFAGGSSSGYVTGTANTDNTSNWTSNVGIKNGRSIGYIYWTFEGNQTTISTTNQWEEARGATTLEAVSQRFDSPDNRELRYTGASLNTFMFIWNAGIKGNDGTNYEIGIRDLVQDEIIPLSIGVQTGSGNARIMAMARTFFIEINPLDNFMMNIRNTENVSNVTVQYMSMCITPV